MTSLLDNSPSLKLNVSTFGSLGYYRTKTCSWSHRSFIILTFAVSVTVDTRIFAADELHRYKLPKVAETTNSDRINEIAFSSDGTAIAAAYGTFISFLQEPRPGVAAAWNVQTETLIDSLSNHKDGICALQFSDDPHILVTASYFGTIKKTNVRTGEELISSHVLKTTLLPAWIAVSKMGTWRSEQWERSKTRYSFTIVDH